MVCFSFSPAAKRRRSSCSQHEDDLPPTTQEDVLVLSTQQDALVPRTRMSGLASPPTDDDRPMFDPSSANQLPSYVASRSSTGKLSKDFSLNPRVTVSPLRSADVVRPSKKSFTDRLAGGGRSSSKNKGRPSSFSEKSKSKSSAVEDTSSGTQARRRSRNIQLTSLFDSLTRFFSTDSDRRRRTAYVNATVSLAQASFNSRHSFASIQPPQDSATEPPRHRKQQPATNTTSGKPAAKKSPRDKRARPSAHRSCRGKSHDDSLSAVAIQESQARPNTMSEPSPWQQAQQQQSAKLPSPSAGLAEVKTQSRRGRSAKNVKRPVANSSALKRSDGAEMKDLMTAAVDESESKLFHTAQTIAQQVHVGSVICL